MEIGSQRTSQQDGHRKITLNCGRIVERENGKAFMGLTRVGLSFWSKFSVFWWSYVFGSSFFDI